MDNLVPVLLTLTVVWTYFVMVGVAVLLAI